MSEYHFGRFYDDVEGDEEADAALSREAAAREEALWGELLPAKRLLQRRGFPVWWHDHAAGQVAVGSRVIDISEFLAMAARHGRMTGQDQ